MKIKIMFPIFCILLLCGCGYIEPEARYTVTALGCSLRGNDYALTVSLTDAGKAAEENTDKGFTVEGEGETISAALDDIRARLSKKPSFSHLRLIAVTGSMNRMELEELLDICIDLDAPLNCPIACCKRTDSLLEDFPAGEELAAQIRENAEYFGYGGHTALFEIKTALLVEEGKFALPILDTGDGRVKVNGLYYFTNGNENYHLNREGGINFLCGLSTLGEASR